MARHAVVTHDEWVSARKALLEREKAFTRERDELSRLRRELPWEKVEKTYVFDGPDGEETLADLFAGRSQLIVYHFMFDPDWDEGCKSCSFLADHYEQADPFLAGGPEPVEGADLRRENPLGVAGAPPEQGISFDAAREEGRHAVDVGRIDGFRLGRADGGDDVDPVVDHRLLGDLVAALAQVAGEPRRHRGFAAAGRVEVDEVAGEVDERGG